MNAKLLLIGLTAIIPVQLCVAQTNQAAVDDWKPATSNQQGKQYPQVNSEGRVRARVMAPQAQNVQIDLGGVKYPLAKGDDGAWIGYSSPQDEGFHYYQIVVDGAQVPDPSSLYFYGASRWGSGVEIPAKDQDFYALKNVPHGQLREVLYFAKSGNTNRHCFVYTPRITTKIPPNVFRCSTCSMARAKMKPAGAVKDTPTLSWTISSQMAKRGLSSLSWKMAAASVARGDPNLRQAQQIMLALSRPTALLVLALAASTSPLSSMF